MIQINQIESAEMRFVAYVNWRKQQKPLKFQLQINFRNKLASHIIRMEEEGLANKILNNNANEKWDVALLASS